jgi:6-phosphogluconolactonase/glucosamine-6-phosphate isomerase/deaminase
MKIKRISNSEDYSIFLFQYFIKNLSKDKINKVVLSGGNTPNAFFKYLNLNINLLKKYSIDFFWVDERCVDIKNPQSNYGNFLKHINFFNLDKIRTFPMYDINRSLDDNICKYTNLIKRTLAINDRFDFGILGMGEDGHIGSIFEVKKNNDLFVQKIVGKDGLTRMSMSISLMNKIDKNILLCNKSKFKILQKKEMNLPVHQIVFDKIIVLIDE